MVTMLFAAVAAALLIGFNLVRDHRRSVNRRRRRKKSSRYWGAYSAAWYSLFGRERVYRITHRDGDLDPPE